MPSLETTVKAWLPAPAKDAVRAGMRAYATSTAEQRPLPDLLVIGTKRGGTTSFWNSLLSHPQMMPMVPAAEHLKSPHYFYWHYHRGERWYRSHFPTVRARARLQARTGHPVVTGEASPYYLYDPRVALRVAAAVPQAKVVVLLRDPVSRAYSHYWERVDQGVEPLSFRDALAAEPGRLAGEVERMHREPLSYSRAHDWYSYRDRGHYLEQLRRWFAVFPREQVLVLRSEDFYADPQAVLSRTTGWLGLPQATLHTERRHNHRPAPRMDADLRAELTDHYRKPNAALAAELGMELGWSS